MSFEAIKSISDAEAAAKTRIAEAEAQARQMIADAEAAGKAALEAASTRAEDELKLLRKKAAEQTAEKTAAFEGEVSAEAEGLPDQPRQIFHPYSTLRRSLSHTSAARCRSWVPGFRRLRRRSG